MPATAFFEWQVIRGQKKKRKIQITRVGGDLVTLAGLYDYGQGVDDANRCIAVRARRFHLGASHRTTAM